MRYTIIPSDDGPHIKCSLAQKNIILTILKQFQAQDIAYQFIVQEWDDQDNCVSQMNGEEWLKENI